jgi:glycosyltransferase involved in cell wall biosynthesis
MPVNRIFICQVVPRDQINLIKGISQAGNNFCRNFILAGNFDKVFSLIPINVDKIIPFEPEGDINISPIQSRFFPHKTIFRFVNAFIENCILVKQLWKYKRSVPIWYYNLTSYNLFSYLILKFIFNRRIYFIIADYSPSRLQFITVQHFILYLIKYSNGSLTLSTNFLELGFRNVKSLAGIINFNSLNSDQKKEDVFNSDIFLFSGSLAVFTGIEMALKVFSRLPNIELWVTGDGPLKPLVEDYSHKYPNIKYFGFLKYNEYLDILKKVTFCINFRNPDLPENKFNFPSKFLEFLSYKKIVLSTVRYEQIPDSVYMYIEFDELLIQKKIQDINKLKKIDFKQNIDRLYIDILNNFGLVKWYKYIVDIEHFKL